MNTNVGRNSIGFGYGIGAMFAPVLIFLLACAPTRCLGQNDNGFLYRVDGPNATITGYSGPGGAVAIPSSFQSSGMAVTSIGPGAFASNSLVTSVTIPGSVTSIGSNAFLCCSNLAGVILPSSITSISDLEFRFCVRLTNIVIPDCVTNIGQMAFSECQSLPSVTIPSGVTCINMGAFIDCYSLTNVVIPASVTNIGGAAFNGCWNLKSVTIPASVTSIEGLAFKDCSSLSSAYFQGNAPQFLELPGLGATVFGGTTLYYPASATGWSTPKWSYYSAYPYYSGSLTVTLSPAEAVSVGAQWKVDAGAWQTNGATATMLPVGDHTVSFNTINCWTTPSSQIVTINSNATTTVAASPYIGFFPFTYSLTGTNITLTGYTGSAGALTIPSSIPGVGTVTAIGDYAFATNLLVTGVTIPNSVTFIGNSAFFCCSNLASVILPSSITSINDLEFRFCGNLTNLVIPNGVTSIGYYAFGNCQSLTRVSIPNSVTSISDAAFTDCFRLTNIVIPNCVTNIGGDAFGQCVSLASVTLPSSLTSINSGMFIDCYNLTNVVIPNSVTNIGGVAFEYCDLRSVTIPASVTFIDSEAFAMCYSLSSAYFQGNAPQVHDTSPKAGGGWVFMGAASTFTIHYPLTATGWSTPTWDARRVILSTSMGIWPTLTTAGL